MSLEERINQDIKAAMMAKEKVKLEALRAIKSAILLAKTDGEHKDSLSTDVEMKLLQKQYKQRKDAAEQYIQAGRQELADKELAEAAFIEEYLPKMLSTDELKAELVKIIEQVGAKAPSVPECCEGNTTAFADTDTNNAIRNTKKDVRFIFCSFMVDGRLL